MPRSRRRILWLIGGSLIGSGLFSASLVSKRYAEASAKECNPMQVSLERSGGFTGIPMTTSVDTDRLSPEAATQLRNLVSTADFFRLPARIPAAAQPDRFQYSLTVTEHNRHHTVTVSESAVPGTLRPLLDWLLDAARRQ